MAHMLSICIPVYNWDVRDLVRELERQAELLSEDVEILVMDDGSQPDYLQVNSEVGHLPHVRYVMLEKNVGRSAIRNQLYGASKYLYCLFLDNDSGIPGKKFLQNYADVMKPGVIYCGGTLYPEDPEKQYALHCKYGTLRESPTSDIRNEKPYQHFKSNNFCICKADFEKGFFDESIKGYGYEDSQFAEISRQNGLDIKHIDNPVQHLGLMSNETFINRQLLAVENLYKLKRSGSGLNTRLWDTYEKINLPIVSGLLRFSLGVSNKWLRSLLLTYKGPLLLLDILKLHKLLKLDKKLV